MAFLPPEHVTVEEVHAASAEVLARPARPVVRSEHVIRIEAMGLEWDIGFALHEPAADRVARDPAGRKVGVLLLHGGAADMRDLEPLARLLAERFGFTVLSGTFPGRLYLPDPSRRWPGDTIAPDGTVRTPIWLEGETIGPGQYTVVRDTSMRRRYGTRTLARARPGSRFEARMAAWPVAFEVGMVEGCRRFLPEDEYIILGEGHSTGGPFICMLAQRIPNMAGVVATEHSPFGEFCARRAAVKGISGSMTGYDIPVDEVLRRTDAFDELYIRTWRDEARYFGPEALGRKGPRALMELPSLMEDVHAEWERVKHYPQFKAEYMVTQGVAPSMDRAARVTAARLGLDATGTEALVERYLDYLRPVPPERGRPLPPFLYSIAKHSRDHTEEVYRDFYLPFFAELDPAPRVSLVRFGEGIHTFWKPLEGLPLGIAPAVGALWERAIAGGYFLGGAPDRATGVERARDGS